MALTHRARKIAGARDKWTCQGVDGVCYTQTLLNTKETISFPNGYYVHLAHYPETQHLSGRGYHDDVPEHARCLCVTCHAVEHYLAGETRATNNVIKSGIYKIDHARIVGQYYLTLDDLDALLEVRTS